MNTDETYEFEEWRDVVGWEEHYSVSSLGRLKRKAFSMVYSDGQQHDYPDHIYNLNKPAENGYFIIGLKSPIRKRKSYYLHRLVAEAFLDKPFECNIVNHINGDRTDNRVSNLEWCTQSHNMSHAAHLRGTMGAVTVKPVRCKELGCVFQSSSDAVKAIDNDNINHKSAAKNIWAAANGAREKALCYHWEFAKEEQ